MKKDIEVMKYARKKELARLKQIALGNGIDNGNDSYYCSMFLDDDCKDCPVKLRTGYSHCRLSPYSEFVRHQSEVHFITQPPYKVDCDECKIYLGKFYKLIEESPLRDEEQLDIFHLGQ